MTYAKSAKFTRQPPDGRIAIEIVTLGEQSMTFTLTEEAWRELLATMPEAVPDGAADNVGGAP